MLLSTIDQLKAHLGRAINSASTLDFISPYIQLAQDEFILPAIGPEMLTELDTQANSTDPTALTSVNRGLLQLVQRALAFYTYQKYLPYSLGNDGDKGLQEQGTDSSKPVRMGVLDVRRRETAENAAKAIESVLLHLFSFPDKYPTWSNSPAYKSTRGLFIASGLELTQYVPQAANSYRLFVSIKPFLSTVERTDLLPLVGAEQYSALKTARLSTTLQTGATLLLLDKVCQVVATCAYAQALYHLNVIQTPGGQLRVLSDFDGIYNQKAVTGHDLSEAQRMADGEASASLNTLKSFLNAHADDYPLYKNSDRYQAKGPNAFPDNSNYRSVYRMR
ncbi:hypothetical protein GCM10028818_01260 [Spirosoma horti]